MKKTLLIKLLFFFISVSYSQDSIVWNTKKDKIKIPFELSHNLIIVDVLFNGVKMKMILDSGANTNLLFISTIKNELSIVEDEKVIVKGIGSGDFVKGTISSDNRMTINNLNYIFLDVLLVPDNDINLYSKLGFPVNGVLSLSIFKEYLIELNYQKKLIILHKKIFQKRNNFFKKALPLETNITNNRFYVNIPIRFNDFNSRVKLLLDSGLSDGLWLFENDSIKCSKNHIDDFLGVGFSGDIYGKRSRLKEIQFSEVLMKEVLVSYPDSKSYLRISTTKGRNGSLGGEVMKRFNWFFDFESNLIYFKKNSFFKLPFEYNMSGLEIFQSGLNMIKEEYSINSELKNLGKRDFFTNNVSETLFYRFKLNPIYTIYSIRNNSPAHRVGISVGDKILLINGNNAQKLSIQDITNIFQSENGKKIKMIIERNGKRINYEFKLEKIL